MLRVLSILDVGDGACSVMRHDDHATIIDCGSNDLGPDVACNRLLAAIGGRPEAITTIVVTHFDTDHYAGFLRLAERMSTVGSHFTSLRLIAPRPPDEAPITYVAQYLALATTVTGIRNLDLALALKNVTAEGSFSYIPVSRSLCQRFQAGGIPFTVHWPPVGLPTRVASEVRTAMRLYGDLSRKLLAMGNNALYNNYRRARYGLWPRQHPYNADNALEEAASQPWQGDAVDIEFWGEEEEEYSDFPEVEALDLPADLRQEFKAAWDSFRRANNNMSIIFDDHDHHSLAVFGDAGKPVLRWLSANGDLAPRYAVMLAPHHGTQSLPRNFNVKADLCISQNGSRRGHLWPRHVDTHDNPISCINTRSGNQHIQNLSGRK
jgi:Metallo-beta-lactamase superfamily